MTKKEEKKELPKLDFELEDKILSLVLDTHGIYPALNEKEYETLNIALAVYKMIYDFDFEPFETIPQIEENILGYFDLKTVIHRILFDIVLEIGNYYDLPNKRKVGS